MFILLIYPLTDCFALTYTMHSRIMSLSVYLSENCFLVCYYYYYYFIIIIILQGIVSVKRLNKFLNHDDLDLGNVTSNPSGR